MTVMVTGGTGFIGARILRKLVERGQRVVCFDLLPPRANLQPYLHAVQVYRGDVTDMTHLLEAVNTHQVTRIVHLAAILPPASEERPHHSLSVNIQGANNVFEIARWTNVERVVYASSISCYGAQDTHGQRPLTEDDPSNPVSVYGMTKAVNDFAASQYIEKYGLDLRGIRVCTVFGHGRTAGLTGLIGGLLISNPAVGKPVDMPFGPAEASAMIYVDDAAEIFVRAVLSDNLRHPVYISGGHPATLEQVADLVRGFVPDARITLGHAQVPHVYLVDSSRMLADIGYELPPLRRRVLDHINEARMEMGVELIPDA